MFANIVRHNVSFARESQIIVIQLMDVQKIIFIIIQQMNVY